MSIVSYAQNFEDVMLWRALGHVSNGFYIDVGAQHPVIDSVSKAFYEHGWRGMHVEATPVYANMVRADRPDEIVLQVALSDKPGSLTFYEIPDTGLSTGDASIAEHHRSRGYNVVETVVPCSTLADVFAQVAQKDVHWLKIDVEGMEAQVLSGWGDRSERPWVLVVESTYPNSQVETHHEWESMVLARGYVHAYFDGLSRYYALADRPDLAQKFNTPPNIFDGFSLAPSVPYNGPTRELMLQKEQLYQDELIGERTNSAYELKALRETLAEREDALGAHISQLQHQVAIALEQQAAALAAHNADAAQQIETLSRQRTEREQALIEQTNGAKNEVESLLRTQVRREQDFAEKVEALRSKAEQESAELSRTFTAQRDVLHGQHAARVQALNQRLEAEQEQRKLLQQERVRREQTLLEQISQAKQEVERLLRNQAQREREVLAQLLAEQQQAKREKAELTRSHAEKVRELGGQQVQRQKALTQQLHAHQQELRNLQKDRVKRDQETAQAKADLLQKQSEKEQALHRQHTEREAVLAQQLQELQQLLQRQHQDGAQLVNALNSEIASLRSQTQMLQQDQQLQAQQHSLELGNKLDEHSRLLEGYSALEAQLQAEMKSGQQASMHLSQLLSEAQRGLDMTHAALSWRVTAPLRRLASLANVTTQQHLKSSTTTQPLNRPKQAASVPTVTALAEPQPDTLPFKLSEPPMPLPAQISQQTHRSVGSTLHELLARHDRDFVDCAYQILLGRAPDADGLYYYLDRLRKGYGKPSVLVQLATSAEAIAVNKHVDGLPALIVEYQRSKHWFWGPIHRRKEQQRQLSKIENELGNLAEQGRRIETHVFQISLKLNALSFQPHLSVALKESVNADGNTPSTAPGVENQLSSSKAIFSDEGSDRASTISAGPLNDKKTPLEQIGRQFVDT